MQKQICKHPNCNNEPGQYYKHTGYCGKHQGSRFANTAVISDFSSKLGVSVEEALFDPSTEFTDNLGVTYLPVNQLSKRNLNAEPVDIDWSFHHANMHEGDHAEIDDDEWDELYEEARDVAKAEWLEEDRRKEFVESNGLEDDYDEWLEENELAYSESAMKDYIEENHDGDFENWASEEIDDLVEWPERTKEVRGFVSSERVQRDPDWVIEQFLDEYGIDRPEGDADTVMDTLLSQHGDAWTDHYNEVSSVVVFASASEFGLDPETEEEHHVGPPVMNYMYPFEADDAYEIAELLADEPLEVVTESPDSDRIIGLSLSGGGMDLSPQIITSYIKAGALPPVHFASRWPRMADQYWTPENKRCLDACRESVSLGLTDDAQKYALEDLDRAEQDMRSRGNLN